MIKTKEQIVEMLKSGDFTIFYNNNEAPTLYQKRWDMEEECERDEYETLNKFEVEFSDFNSGYCPEIVRLLTEALGGLSGSI